MTTGVPSAARVRAYLAGAAVTLGLVGVAVRAWALQIDDGDRYRALADRQHELRIEIPAPRGEVLDARGRPLAVSADVESVWANPRDVHDVAATADALAALVGGDPRALEAKLAGDHRFVWIDRHAAPELVTRVRAARLAGIEIAREPRRFYPARELAGAVIGRADIDGNGLDGIELTMNDVLAGQRGQTRALRDARGHRMLADGLAPDEPGATVHLSLDSSIQAIAQHAVADSVIEHKAQSGVAVVLDVATGRVLALASYPTSDPNDDAARPARDRPVTDAFEAGSVMKVFSVATALDAGAVTPDTEFEIGNELIVGRRPIHDVEFDAYLTVAGIVKRSSNIGAARIALRLGRDRLYAGLRRFGLGARTGIELPGEQTGMLRDGATWRDIDLAHIAFGYGLTITPIQLAAGIAAIGDHGRYHAPRIVEEVDDADGTIVYRPDDVTRQVVSPKTAEQMMVMLASVFDKGKQAGTAASIVVPGFTCGGKTGTAHKYDPATKTYSPDRYLSSFAGLAPIAAPRIAVVVMIDDPSGGDYYGAKVAAPVFAIVASETLRYLGVPGDPVAVAVPAPLPVPGPSHAATGGGLPDFTGLGLSRALDLARERHLAIDVHGSGRVISQDPPAGSPTSATGVTLRLADER